MGDDQSACLAGKHVVFGQVVDGYPVIQAAEACGSGSGSTAFDVMIKDCGQVPKGSVRGGAAAGERQGSPQQASELGVELRATAIRLVSQACGCEPGQLPLT